MAVIDPLKPTIPPITPVGTTPVAQPLKTTAATAQPGLINGVAQAGVREIDGTLRTVQSNETVQGQLAGIMNVESPLMQQARAKAKEGMQERGLVNSAMAETAGQSAVIDKSLQIATPDAATYSQASRDNQAVQNATSQFNANSWNRNQEFNSGETNKFGIQTLADKGAMDRSQLQADTSIKTTGMNNAASLEQTRMNNATSITTQKMSNDAQVLTTQMNNEVSKYTAGLNAETQRSVTSMQIAANESLRALDRQHAATLQNNSSAQTIYRDGTKSITEILMNPDLDGPTRERAITNVTGMINAGLDLSESTMRIDIPMWESGINVAGMNHAQKVAAHAAEGRYYA